MLLNVEDRVFTPINILTVALGGVFFFDAGTVWDDAVDLSQLNYSIGFGIRLGYTKSPNSRVGRIDFAWPLNRGGGFGVAIGVDQQFTLN
jgi:outer membrane translocation and assembly module TamA